MKIQVTTDYAIRMVIYMAQRGSQLSAAKEASVQLGITYGYFNKIAAKLRRAGLIDSVQGPRGGYILLKPAEDITLYDVIEIMEGSIRLNNCLEDDGFCSRNAVQACQVHKILGSLQNEIIEKLKGVRICDLDDPLIPVNECE